MGRRRGLVHISCELFLACVFVSSRDAPTLAITTTDLKPSGYPPISIPSSSQHQSSGNQPRQERRARDFPPGAPHRVRQSDIYSTTLLQCNARRAKHISTPPVNPLVHSHTCERHMHGAAQLSRLVVWTRLVELRLVERPCAEGPRAASAAAAALALLGENTTSLGHSLLLQVRRRRRRRSETLLHVLGKVPLMPLPHHRVDLEDLGAEQSLLVRPMERLVNIGDVERREGPRRRRPRRRRPRQCCLWPRRC
jgi:hypothetical protein